jgi:phosphate transport system substrate-binding protein
MKFSMSAALSLLLLTVAHAVAATSSKTPQSSVPALVPLAGSIVVDGSSTVFPILEAVASEFQKTQSKVNVSVAVSGTGGGFKRFCMGEVDMVNASRPIKEEEKAKCAERNVRFIEFPVAFDGVTIVTSAKNDFLKCLSSAEVKKIWEPGSTIKSWNQVRAEFPNKPIRLFGPGHNSGTFDYFTEAINGKQGATRSDYVASEDDNVLVRGVQNDPTALGYFGYSYYLNNSKALKAVAVDGGQGCKVPNVESIRSGSYSPLARPLFVYVSEKAMARSEVQSLARYLVKDSGTLIEKVGYVSLTDKLHTLALERLDKKVFESVFGPKVSHIGVNIEQLYSSRR